MVTKDFPNLKGLQAAAAPRRTWVLNKIEYLKYAIV